MSSLTQLKKDFTALLARDRLFHAYLLFGEAAQETNVFVENFAQFLETGAWDAKEPLIDFRVVDTAAKEGGIDSVRSLRHFLYQMPLRSKRRTLLVRRADRLTVPAQQALLKLTEEPPATALIVLTVSHKEILLPALLSRFQKIFISGQDKGSDEGKELLATFLGLDARTRKEFLKELGEDRSKEELFLRALLLHLHASLTTDWPIAKELLARIVYLNQYSVNRRLQIEAALQDVQ